LKEVAAGPKRCGKTLTLDAKCKDPKHPRELLYLFINIKIMFYIQQNPASSTPEDSNGALRQHTPYRGKGGGCFPHKPGQFTEPAPAAIF